MKLNWNTKYTTIAAYCLIVIFISILFVVLIFKYEFFAAKLSWLMGVLAPIIIGLVVAYILNPLMMFFENKLFGKIRDQKVVLKDPKAENADKLIAKKTRFRKKLARALAIIVTYIVIFALLTALCVAVLPNVAQSIVDLTQQMPQYISNLEKYLQDLFKNNPSISMFVSEEFSELSNILMKVTEYIEPMATDIIGTVSSGLFGMIASVFVALKNVLVGFIIAIYLLIGKERLLAQARKTFFALFKNDNCQRALAVGAKTHNIFTTYINSNLLDAFIIFAAMMVGTTLMGIPYATLVSVVCGVTNLIPFFGPFIGAIPCAVLIILVDPIKVVWFALFVLVLQQLDGNLIKPLLFGESTGLPAIWVLVSILVCGGLFGMVGMLLGVPVFAVIYLLFAEFVSTKLKKKHLPTDTDKFHDISMYNKEYAEPEESAAE
ncbi:MAG: AI-2E family transporter [Ruminococcaceae bacterium]|nr:AI-2E family transporter [Oscillospiraceae bacterium]